LKARWAFLTKTVDLKLESVPTVIYACFVLHNVCEQKKVTVDDQSLKEQISLMKQNEEQFKNIPDPVYSYNEGEGEIVRSSLLKILKECL
jgi:FKBP-type peptidyl-prolyl cis-trans isomerase (trigger factor)